MSLNITWIKTQQSLKQTETLKWAPFPSKSAPGTHVINMPLARRLSPAAAWDHPHEIVPWTLQSSPGGLVHLAVARGSQSSSPRRNELHSWGERKRFAGHQLYSSRGCTPVILIISLICIRPCKVDIINPPFQVRKLSLGDVQWQSRNSAPSRSHPKPMLSSLCCLPSGPRLYPFARYHFLLRGEETQARGSVCGDKGTTWDSDHLDSNSISTATCKSHFGLRLHLLLSGFHLLDSLRSRCGCILPG